MRLAPLLAAAGLLGGLLGASPAHAFPEYIRHGYQNCVTCHVSPNGGGVLTEYGRELSKEIVSTWSRDNEQKFAYNLVHLPSWLQMGGDYRSLYLYQSNSAFESLRWIFMQGDLEAAATLSEKFQAVATVGYQEPAKNQLHPGFADYVILRRHYLIYRPLESWALRVGKFDRAYGLKVAEHTVPTRRGLGFDQGTETYNVEASYIGEKVNAFVTAVLGRPDTPELQRESGVALTGAYAVGDTHKVGFSYYYGSNEQATRNVLGPFAALGFTPSLFLLSEVGFVNRMPAGAGSASSSTWGLANYEKLGYEVHQGVIPFVDAQHLRSDFASERTQSEAYGLGVQWLPRPHLDFIVEYQRARAVAAGPDFSDVLLAMLHFYL